MRKLMISLTVIFLVAMPVHAMDFTAPPAPPSAQEFMSSET